MQVNLRGTSLRLQELVRWECIDAVLAVLLLQWPQWLATQSMMQFQFLFRHQSLLQPTYFMGSDSRRLIAIGSVAGSVILPRAQSPICDLATTSNQALFLFLECVLVTFLGE